MSYRTRENLRPSIRPSVHSSEHPNVHQSVRMSVRKNKHPFIQSSRELQPPKLQPPRVSGAISTQPFQPILSCFSCIISSHTKFHPNWVKNKGRSHYIRNLSLVSVSSETSFGSQSSSTSRKILES